MSRTANTRGRLAPLVIVVILLGWLFSLAVGALQQNWEPLTVTTPALLLVAGYSFGINITKAGERKDED